MRTETPLLRRARHWQILIALAALLTASAAFGGTASEIGREIGKGSREAAQATKEAGKTVGETLADWSKSAWEGLKDFGKSLKEGWNSGESSSSDKEKSKGNSR